jgi:hypothetical protein
MMKNSPQHSPMTKGVALYQLFPAKMFSTKKPYQLIKELNLIKSKCSFIVLVSTKIKNRLG